MEELLTMKKNKTMYTFGYIETGTSYTTLDHFSSSEMEQQRKQDGERIPVVITSQK